jgi:hypothetical protein
MPELPETHEISQNVGSSVGSLLSFLHYAAVVCVWTTCKIYLKRAWGPVWVAFYNKLLSVVVCVWTTCKIYLKRGVQCG